MNTIEKQERLKELAAERKANNSEKIRVQREVLSPFKAKDDELREEMMNLQDELLEEATGTCGKLAPGTWDCESSPIGVCAYDLDDDLCCDQCVFCGDPEERK